MLLHDGLLDGADVADRYRISEVAFNEVQSTIEGSAPGNGRWNLSSIGIFGHQQFFETLKQIVPQQSFFVRISLDLRYQSATEPVDQSSLTPHVDVTTWEEIYKGWKNEKLKYYWKSRDLKISPWDPSLLQGSERIC